MMVKGVRKMSEIDDLLGKPGESVPVVDAADLKVMWDYSQEVLAMHPGATGAAVGAAAWKDMCRPGTDIRAVGYRFTILMMGRWRAEQERLQGCSHDRFGLAARRCRSARVAVQPGSIRRGSTTRDWLLANPARPSDRVCFLLKHLHYTQSPQRAGMGRQRPPIM
jgi:hypothetical protein